MSLRHPVPPYLTHQCVTRQCEVGSYTRASPYITCQRVTHQSDMWGHTNVDVRSLGALGMYYMISHVNQMESYPYVGSNTLMCITLPICGFKDIDVYCLTSHVNEHITPTHTEILYLRTYM